MSSSVLRISQAYHGAPTRSGIRHGPRRHVFRETACRHPMPRQPGRRQPVAFRTRSANAFRLRPVGGFKPRYSSRDPKPAGRFRRRPAVRKSPDCHQSCWPCRSLLVRVVLRARFVAGPGASLGAPAVEGPGSRCCLRGSAAPVLSSPMSLRVTASTRSRSLAFSDSSALAPLCVKAPNSASYSGAFTEGMVERTVQGGLFLSHPSISRRKGILCRSGRIVGGTSLRRVRARCPSRAAIAGAGFFQFGMAVRRDPRAVSACFVARLERVRFGLRPRGERPHRVRRQNFSARRSEHAADASS